MNESCSNYIGMNKQNLVLYGAHTPLGFAFWQLFQSEARVWVADKRVQIPGASFWQDTFFNKPINLSRAVYRPVNGVIIFSIHKDDILELFKAVQTLQHSPGEIKVLFANNVEEDLIELLKELLPNIDISCLIIHKDIKLIEDFYFISEVSIKGGSCSYWKEFLEDGLFGVNVTVES